MNKGNLTLVFNHFEFGQEHFGKDVFLVPYYLGKRLGTNVTIVYPRLPTNINFPELKNGVKLIPLDFRKDIAILPFWKHLNFYIYLLKNAKSIDYLVRFHHSLHTELTSILYKLINVDGKVYVKLDINPDAIDNSYGAKFTLKRKIHNIITKLFINKVDLFSCETTYAFQKIKSVNFPELQYGSKLHLIPNGFHEEMLEKLNLEERNFFEKENLIITVGRIGTEQKNTEMLLRALSEIELKNWKVCLIGNVDPRLDESIETFFRENPDKRDSVKFTGSIHDKKELWEYFNRAKVFVLTSDWEGYPIVYTEAKRFRNYIVSTAIAACRDIIEEERYGVCIPIRGVERLAEVLNEIVSGNRITDVYQDFNVNEISWQTQVQKIKFT